MNQKKVDDSAPAKKDAVRAKDDEPGDEHEDDDILNEMYAAHGGVPTKIDLSKSLLLHSLPSAMLSDSYELFHDSIVDLLMETFKIKKDSIDGLVRIPVFQKDAESEENALRAIVSFKTRVHKHRVYAQKKAAEESAVFVATVEELPAEFLDAKQAALCAIGGVDDGEFEMADEVGADEDVIHYDVGSDDEEEEYSGEEDDGSFQDDESEGHKEDDDVDGNVKQKGDKSSKESDRAEKKTSKRSAKEGSTTEKPRKKAYIDDDESTPYEISWDGCPELQWKVEAHSLLENRQLILENLYWSDLQNVFIYRAIIAAESANCYFPMRYNISGTKSMMGKLTLTYKNAFVLVQEVCKHLIYARTPKKRLIRILLPQAPAALKMRTTLESYMGHLIKPTPRMYELVVKILPKDFDPVLDDACKWFPNQSVIKCEKLDDEMGQPCAVVTFETVEEAVAGHSSTSLVKVGEGDKQVTCHVYMRGVEAHYGSLLTMYDRRRYAESKGTLKRPLREPLPYASKRGRGGIAPARGYPPRGVGSLRGGYQSSYRGSYPTRSPLRGSIRGRGAPRAMRSSYAPTSVSRSYPVARSYDPQFRSHHSYPERDYSTTGDRRPASYAEKPATYANYSQSRYETDFYGTDSRRSGGYGTGNGASSSYDTRRRF